MILIGPRLRIFWLDHVLFAVFGDTNGTRKLFQGKDIHLFLLEFPFGLNDGPIGKFATARIAGIGQGFLNAATGEEFRRGSLTRRIDIACRFFQ